MFELWEIWGGYFWYDIEGFYIYKCGVWYYLFVVEGGIFKNYVLCIVCFKNIWGLYEFFSGNLVFMVCDMVEFI